MVIPTLVLNAQAAFSCVMPVCAKSTTGVSTYLCRYCGDLAPENLRHSALKFSEKKESSTQNTNVVLIRPPSCWNIELSGVSSPMGLDR